MIQRSKPGSTGTKPRGLNFGSEWYGSAESGQLSISTVAAELLSIKPRDQHLPGALTKTP